MVMTLSSDPVPVALAVMAAVLVVVFLLLRLLRRPKARAAQEIWVLVDGSNVMHWQGNTPKIAPVQKVVTALKAMGYFPGVVFDANAGWKLAGKYLHDGDFARWLPVEQRQVLVVPKGSQADCRVGLPISIEAVRRNLNGHVQA